eukprot:TRINITY_DN10398_c0_g1_i1.p1 TRINITY_DN10398_c0_g1~~TRINITY_DN10398_c0_g1_i1.p1  ORF type:complete len:440 (+),score=72.16 TRINITY_DN10398_c0_g1_i1:78-1322(+)
MQTLQLGSLGSPHHMGGSLVGSPHNQIGSPMLGSPHSGHYEYPSYELSSPPSQNGLTRNNRKLQQQQQPQQSVQMGERPAPLVVRCCDPYNQKVYDVPSHCVDDTLGKHTYTSNPSGRRAQICMKYQDGQCNMKARCQQIHADRTWVQELRSRFYDSRKVYVSDILATNLETGEVIAFKYSEVDSCQAKDKYRSLSHHQRSGFALCNEYLASNTCREGRACTKLHVSAEKYTKAINQTEGKSIKSPTSPMSPMSPCGNVKPQSSYFDQMPGSPVSQYCMPQVSSPTMSSPTGYWGNPQSPVSEHDFNYFYNYNTPSMIQPVAVPTSTTNEIPETMPIAVEKEEVAKPIFVITPVEDTGRGRSASGSSTPTSRSRSAPPPDAAEPAVASSDPEFLPATRKGSMRSRSLMAHVERD